MLPDPLIRSLLGAAAAHARDDLQAVDVLLDDTADQVGVDVVIVHGIGVLVELLQSVADTRGVSCARFAGDLLGSMSHSSSLPARLFAMVSAAARDDEAGVAAGLGEVCADPDALVGLAGLLAEVLTWQATDREVAVDAFIREWCHAAAMLSDVA